MVSAAVGCMGTPFHHQGRLPRVGLDCIGLVIVALRASGIAVCDRFDYGVRPDGVLLIAALKEHGAFEVDKIRRGDVLVFRYDNQPQHVALALNEGELIHSFAPAGCVVKSSIGSYWKRRLVAIFRFKQRECE